MIKQIWTSFRSLQVWVQVWVGIVLVPVNMASRKTSHQHITNQPQACAT